MNSNIEPRIRDAIAEIRSRHPWIAYVIGTLKLEFTTEFKTFATDGVRLLVNPVFAATLTMPQLCGVLVHEGIHVINKHMCRRGNRNPRLWNMACDHTVNYVVGALLYILPEGALAPISGQTAEIIYHEDYEQDEPEQDEPEQGESEQGEGDSEPADGAESGEGGSDTDDTSEDAEGDSDASDVTNGGIGNPETDDDVDLLDYPLEPGQTMEDAEKEIDQRLSEADIYCKMSGSEPSPIERGLIDQRQVETDLHWPTELEDFMLQAGGATFTMNPPHIGLMQQGIICNQLNPQGCGNVVLVVDASGSIDEDKLELAVTHLQLFLSNIDYESLRLIVHSDEIEHDIEYMRGEPLDIDMVRGGGGTAFADVYDRIAEGQTPDLVIHFTDMETRDMHDYPAPDYPVIWLVDGVVMDDNGDWRHSVVDDCWYFTPDWGHRINARQ